MIKRSLVRFLMAFSCIFLAASLSFAGAKETAQTKTTRTVAEFTESTEDYDSTVGYVTPGSVVAEPGCCSDYRSGGGCWRKCGGNWKDVLPSEEYCQITDASAKCRAEYRSGGGCWMRCRGFLSDKWKNQVDESFCQIRKCGSTQPAPIFPPDNSEINPPSQPSAGCCVDFRSGGGCWRKCGGKWKDVMSDESICRDSDPTQHCYAEFRSGGGCWRKCGGKWKDQFPTEEPCQVRRCK